MYAFFDNRLESITIPDSVRNIGDGAFASSPLKTVMISPELLHKTSVGAFPSGVAFKDHDGKEITRWKTLPPITDENGVTSIIRDDKNRILSKHLKISPTLKTIPPSRFADSELTDVTIPDEIESVGDKAFAASPNLKSVTISQWHLNRINPNAFPPGVVFRDFSGKMIISILKNTSKIDTDGSKTTITVNDKGETVFRSLEVSPTLKAIPKSRFADKKLNTVRIPRFGYSHRGCCISGKQAHRDNDSQFSYLNRPAGIHQKPPENGNNFPGTPEQDPRRRLSRRCSLQEPRRERDNEAGINARRSR